MEHNDIINGVVYREGEKLILISLYDEKKREIFEDKYFSLAKNKTPIKEESFVLVEYVERDKRITTKPISIIDLYYADNQSIPAHKLSLDGLIKSVYNAAKKYIEAKKAN